jgi:holo-[acyl-carrier protein] synthase
MIIGIGLDVVELERMARLLAGPGRERFAERILTESERASWRRLPERRALEYISGRFAAKEAVVKAIGCGIGAIVGFRDIEVMPDSSGKPTCKLSEDALARLGWNREPTRLHIAITHERSIAAATAIIEK